jgi:TPR repeat protein
VALTPEQFDRACDAEASQLRMARLQQLSYRELQEILAAAQLRLGRMLLEGTGVAADPAAALSWFSRAAAQGDAEAMNMVGRCLENGWGTPVDLGGAAAQYRASAQRGHDWGEYNFGNMLFDGRGVACDRKLAVQWYRRAARQGHGRAMNLLGRCLEEGWGGEPDPASAVLWYERSAETGYFRGQFNYAAVLAQYGQAAAAASWYLKAADGGDRAIRGAIVTALRNAVDPALCAVRVRVAALDHTAGGHDGLSRHPA